jgi:DNA mismatch repair protein MutS2
MSRTAQDVLEFDKLRELLRQRTTSVLGRRSVDALAFSQNVSALQQQFALIREARAWLRSGRDLGFGALSDPETWLAKIEGPGAALEPAEFLEASSLLETSSWLRVQFREEDGAVSLAGGANRGCSGFSRCPRLDSALRLAQWRNQ